jgi:two-component system alkaline phosphatase synthesis response regulator PhoP
LKIFIVDDDFEVIEIMKTVLEGAGHEVDSNVSGEEAVSGIRTMKPDCVIIDLMMAALDGLELCDEVRQIPELNEAKIIMVSARDADHWKEKASEHGAAGYITKPIDPASFATQISTIVDGAS